ncbi:MAG: hypothetical protein ACLP8B_21085, partial [Xanthobacteraceae bacterium]
TPRAFVSLSFFASRLFPSRRESSRRIRLLRVSCPEPEGSVAGGKSGIYPARLILCAGRN